jgi:hypothetical protein
MIFFHIFFIHINLIQINVILNYLNIFFIFVLFQIIAMLYFYIYHIVYLMVVNYTIDKNFNSNMINTTLLFPFQTSQNPTNYEHFIYVKKDLLYSQRALYK